VAARAGALSTSSEGSKRTLTSKLHAISDG
jgi:hypothetical protein